MSTARENLIGIAYHGTEINKLAAIEAAVDAFAHALAEKIRAHAAATTKPGSVGYAGIMTGANVIDPKMTP